MEFVDKRKGLQTDAEVTGLHWFAYAFAPLDATKYHMLGLQVRLSFVTYPAVMGWSWSMTWVLFASSESPSPFVFTITTSPMDTVTSSGVAITLRVDNRGGLLSFDSSNVFSSEKFKKTKHKKRHRLEDMVLCYVFYAVISYYI